jgi:hypothetical protein
MSTKTKIAIAAALFAATSSTAFAQGFDPNMANRYPSYANPVAPTAHATTERLHTAPVGLHTAPVRLHQRNALPNDNGGAFTGQTEFNIDRSDRAASPYAGGGF